MYAETQPLIRSVLDGERAREQGWQSMPRGSLASRLQAPRASAHCEVPNCIAHRILAAGYNVCIFAYGQTGSGKGRLQLTLHGGAADSGVPPLMLALAVHVPPCLLLARLVRTTPNPLPPCPHAQARRTP